jgi:hypothetical protein
MEILVLLLVCLLIGALYGKRAPDDAETHHSYQVEPAKRDAMQFSTFVFMSIYAAIVIPGVLAILTVVLSVLLQFAP